jgi:phosphoglycerate dehydrogenase-like enzyme
MFCYLTLHIPGGKANRHIIDAQALGRMKPDSVIVNAVRGELIDEAVLTAALQSGHLLAAACDTFESAPLSPDSPLCQMDSMVMTPHCAGGVMDHAGPMAEHAVRNLQLFLRNEKLAEADRIVVPSNPRPGYTAVRSKPA